MAEQASWSIQGKVCMITGANTGIGYETALELVRRGTSKVIMACRNLALAEEAMKKIIEETRVSDDRMQVVKLDLSSLKSVRECAEAINKKEVRLDVLINNAAVHASNQGRTLSSDGYELTFATNHLGHFLLVDLLLPLLKRSTPSRIVVVASDAYNFCLPRGLDIDDLNAEQPGKYEALRAYNHSKLANILYARTLHHRLNGKPEDNNASSTPSSGVSVFSLHPGFVKTTLPRNQTATFQACLKPLHKLFAKTPTQGAETSLYCACELGIEKFSGGYFKERKHTSVWGIAKDDVKAEKLWQLSEQMISDKSN